MATRGQVFDMTPLGMRFTVLKSSADTDGESLDLHWELFPGCNMSDPLIHIHPNAIETYEVKKGEMEFYVGDRWITAAEGSRLTVPEGVPHSFRNPTDDTVIVYNTHEPALHMEDFFEDSSRILGQIADRGANDVRMYLKRMLYMSALMNDYRAEIVAVRPPDFVIRFLGIIAQLLRVRY
jgi:mannose-6-phosphate isomerase-like protein (cupin superfamily)